MMPARNLEPLKHKFNACLIILAVIFLSVAASINWWSEGHDNVMQYDIWKIVQCFSSVCKVSTNSAGWINFVRLMMIVGLVCFGTTLFSQLLYILYKPRPIFRQAALVFSGIAGGVLSITGFVTAGFFNSIGKQYNTLDKRRNLDPKALRFHTLPLGFIFLAAFISSIVAVFTLVNIEPKKRRKTLNLGDYEMEAVPQTDKEDNVEVLGVKKLPE